MATVTLVESAKLAQNQLIVGVIENIVTVNAWYEVMPFDNITGNALQYNREANIAPVAAVGIGDVDGTIGPVATAGVNFAERALAKNAATFTSVTSSLTTILGDAEVNGLIDATRSSDGNDQTAVQIASKAKAAGRKYQAMLINGDGTNNSFPGLISLVDPTQKVATGVNGGALSFQFLDELMDLVTDRDGQLDYITMHARTIRSFKALLRTLGGASVSEVVALPSGAEVPVYNGVPIFRNDWIPINQIKGAGTNQTTIFAGTFDDGSRTTGIAGLTAEKMSGINVVPVGESETKDEMIWRVKWYCGLALFSLLGLSAADGITN
jgi:hypothetical protein